MATPRELAVDVGELILALQTDESMATYFLDAETGELHLRTDEGFAGDDGDLAERIEEGFGTRYLHVPSVSSQEAYGDMVEFTQTVPDEQFARRLEGALIGRGAFRRFKDVLVDHTAERERWFAFQRERMGDREREWLAEHGLALAPSR